MNLYIRLFVFSLLWSICFFSCNFSNSPSEVFIKKGIITKVSDGDSVNFFDGTDTIKIRLQHIDAPERNQALSKLTP